ncbi:MAG TPA: zinc-dependent metalloprotease family protein [Vicinamibacterales bacterium]|nr:zinc-dependent metalloprotease family protein [Vicinamibacterales bacterium]
MFRLIVAGLIAASSAASGSAQAPAVPALLLPATAGARVPAAVLARVETLGARAAQANLQALAAAEFDVEVTAGRTLRARLDRRESHRNGAQTWAGHAIGEPLSTVTIVAMGGVVQGSIRTLDGAWLIEPAPGGTFSIVRQVDADAIGTDAEPLLPPPAPPGSAIADAPTGAGDDGGTFDILVFYTPAALAVAGSDAAAQTRIALGVSETNTAYANSGITPRLRLVGAELITYTEAGDLGVDLGRLQDPSDGIMDAVHTRRNELGADLVMLVAGNTAAGACGVGYVMTSLSSSFAPYAFMVTAYPCISPNYTFAHELGHNMGSAHAPEDGSSQSSLYAYSFGYKNPSSLFRTVMAYNCTTGCPRLLHFSNPGVSYNGATTGTSLQHDNARALDSAATTIANWRQAVGGGSAPTISTIGNATTNEDTATAPMAFTIGDAETAAASLVVTAVSDTTALVPNNGAALALGGSGANRTLVVTPAANQFGTATITVTVSDGALTASRSFTLTVASVNDAPTVGAIGATTTAEDTPLTINVTVGDADTPLGNLVLQASSSNTALVPVSGVVFGGSGATRTATITPGADQSGVATLTFSVSDGAASAAASFSLTVTAVNDPPAYGAGAPTGVSTLVDIPVSFAVTVTDADTAGASLTLTGTTTNAAALTNGGIAVVPTSSTATSRTFTVTLTPVGGAVGAGGVMLSAGDGTTQVTHAVTVSITANPGPPDPPVGLTATVSGTALQLAWMAAATGTTATSYEVSVGTAPGATTVPVQTTSGTALSVIVPAGATYYARVRAVNGYGTSIASPEVSVTITVFDPKPGRPAQFGAWFSGRSVTVSWAAPTTGDPVTDYVLEGGSAPGLADFGTVHLGTATSFTVGGVPDGTFWLRLRGTNDTGAGPNSPELALVMGPGGGCVGLPMAPTYHPPNVTGNDVTLSWSAPTEGAAPVSYVLIAGWAPGTADVAVLDLGSPATSVSGIVPDGTYFVRMAARGTCGVGPASNERPLVVGGTPGGSPR